MSITGFTFEHFFYCKRKYRGLYRGLSNVVGGEEEGLVGDASRVKMVRIIVRKKGCFAYPVSACSSNLLNKCFFRLVELQKNKNQ